MELPKNLLQVTENKNGNQIAENLQAQSSVDFTTNENSEKENAPKSIFRFQKLTLCSIITRKRHTQNEELIEKSIENVVKRIV